MSMIPVPCMHSRAIYYGTVLLVALEAFSVLSTRLSTPDHQVGSTCGKYEPAPGPKPGTPPHPARCRHRSVSALSASDAIPSKFIHHLVS